MESSGNLEEPSGSALLHGLSRGPACWAVLDGDGEDAVAVASDIARSSTIAMRVGRQAYGTKNGMELTSAPEHRRYALPTLLAAIDGKSA